MNIQALRSWLLDERNIVRAVTSTTADNISAFAEVTGMLSMPFIPALLTALSLVFGIQANTETNWPEWAAIAVAVVVVIALESLGITAAKTALRLYRAWQDQLSLGRDFAATVMATMLYASLVFAIIALGEGLPVELKWVGYASPFLAVTLYVVVGLNSDLQERVDRKEVAISFETQIENEVKLADLDDYKLRMQLKREADMADYQDKLEAKRRKREERSGPRLSPKQTRIEARKLLAQYPKISGAELGRRLNVSERTGQSIINEFNGKGK